MSIRVYECDLCSAERHASLDGTHPLGWTAYVPQGAPVRKGRTETQRFRFLCISVLAQGVARAVSRQRPHADPKSGGQGVQSQALTKHSDATRAPFPWMGGKRRWAASIWSKLGDPGVYAEPFAGSLAVLLHRRQPCPREITCDSDGLLCNFWRALRADPEAVAYWAAWPTIHQDLTARHLWLRQWRADHTGKVEADPDFYDAKTAGWWVWGLSNWIGGGWCAEGARADGKLGQVPVIRGKDNLGQGVQAQRGPHDQRPHVGAQGVRSYGQGVQAQRGPHEKRPHVQNHGSSGYGVQAQRGGMDKRPLASSNSGASGQGVQAQRSRFRNEPTPSFTGDILDGTRWAPWFAALAKRLERVVVLNRSWESAVTPTLLQQTPSAPKPPVAIFMDPPYLTHDRDQTIYHGDEDADDVARAALAWAIEHGDRYRIAYACGASHFDVPDGWHAETLSFAGVRDETRRVAQRDMIMYSPACLGQQPLF